MTLSRIRYDDVLWSTSDPKMKGKEFQKFKKHIDWCDSLTIPQSPAILCQDIEAFPECIDYLKEETQEGRLFPELHGWDHGAYGERTEAEIDEHLSRAMEWFERRLEVIPGRWVTPHGANSYAMQASARKFGLIIEDTTFPVIDQKEADTLLRQHRDLRVLTDRVLMVHWWYKGLSVYRIAQSLKHGSVEEAIKRTKSELDSKSWNICWNNWI